MGVFNVNGSYYALRNRCPHQGAPLCEGSVLDFVESPRPGCFRTDASKKLLRCPWHGWEFELATGRALLDPDDIRVRSYPLSLCDSAMQKEEGNVTSGQPRQGADGGGMTYTASVECKNIVVHLRTQDRSVSPRPSEDGLSKGGNNAER